MTDQYILSLSYGKDSLACLGAIEKLGWKLNDIVHAEVWATDDIPADLPPMVEFKAKADKIIKDRWGIEVKHLCATCDSTKKHSVVPIGGGIDSLTMTTSTTERPKASGKETSTDSQLSKVGGAENSRYQVASTNTLKKTYEDIFYRIRKAKSKRGGQIIGFPMIGGGWCTSELKSQCLITST